MTYGSGTWTLTLEDSIDATQHARLIVQTRRRYKNKKKEAKKRRRKKPTHNANRFTRRKPHEYWTRSKIATYASRVTPTMTWARLKKKKKFASNTSKDAHETLRTRCKLPTFHAGSKPQKNEVEVGYENCITLRSKVDRRSRKMEPWTQLHDENKQKCRKTKTEMGRRHQPDS